MFISSLYRKRSPKILETLTPNLPYKESLYVRRILVSSMPLYKHQTSSFLRYMKIPNSHTIEFLGNIPISDLTFEGSLASTPLVLSVNSLFSYFSGTFIGAHGLSTHWWFCASSLPNHVNSLCWLLSSPLL